MRGDESVLEVVMVSRGEPDENRHKIKEHGLTFPVVLQKKWQVSREYLHRDLSALRHHLDADDPLPVDHRRQHGLCAYRPALSLVERSMNSGRGRRIDAFCHLEVPPEKIPVIVERCSFAFMKQYETKFDPALELLWESGTHMNSFLRAGRSGEGVNELTPEHQVRFDQVFRMLLKSSFAWSTRVPAVEDTAQIRNVLARV